MPKILSSACCVGKTESEGPLAKYFDYCYPDDGINMPTWEKAETELSRKAIELTIQKANLDFSDIDIVFSGDLLNQCTASNYSLRNSGVPIAGLFGACSTMALSLALSSILVNAENVKNAVAATSSHFCSAEKQFRYPLEYGSQRAPSSQRTVTGAGAFLIGNGTDEKVAISRVMFGSVVDYGIIDSANMGAAMAPAAADTIGRFFKESHNNVDDYDMILTGDLGSIGSELLIKLLKEDFELDISEVHNDCGLLIFDTEKQDVKSGGSGCGCSASVTASYIMNKLRKNELKRVLFAGTGALMSPLISMQGESIPSVAHIVEFCRTEG